MSLQTDDLVMIGRGVSNGATANPSGAPSLADGIHLRYGFARDRGFPWYGYYLFRRLHADRGKPTCVYPPRSVGPRLSSYPMAQGKFSTPNGYLQLDDAFAPAGLQEWDLRTCKVLRYDLPAGQTATEVKLNLGIYGGSGTGTGAGSGPSDGSGNSGCLVAPFQALQRAVSRAFQPRAAVYPGPIHVTAWSQGVAVAQADCQGAPGAVVLVTLDADDIDSVTVDATNCLNGGCAVIEICYTATLADIGSGWYRLDDFVYPQCLPSPQPGYPCATKPVDAVSATDMAVARVCYDDPLLWRDGRFGEMTQFLDDMLAGGPAAGTMAGRSSQVFAQNGTANDPHMPSLYPLDMLLLGALNPAVAQVLGLYWVDATAVDNVAYDYIVLADHDGSFANSGARALAILTSGTLPSGVDAYIVSNLVKAPAPVLAAPSDPRCYALPPSYVASTQTPAPAGANTAGLTWTLPVAPGDGLLPQAPIAYHIWRNSLGAAQPSGAPSAGAWITGDRPVFVTEVPVPPGATQRARDWPPFSMFAYDRNLIDGWYSYRLAGVDIFGQFTQLSAPARWYQWAPIPDPKPWYYVGNVAADAAVNPWAVHLRDTSPPPPPSGVEAYVLDPDDPMLMQDLAYRTWIGENWWNGRTAAQKAAAIGVRVKWRWLRAQQLQAPDTREFRLYFNPGSVLPSDGRNPAAWNSRFFVVDYASHVTVNPTDGAREYEVLLPLQNVNTFAGLPMAPDNANPVIYAQIGVSAADDKSATGDDLRWAGTPFGNRTGNEGRLGVPAMVYRVLHSPPPAPGIADLSDRVWASRADYHSLSYYTFRWPKPAGPDAGLIDAHVFRALDEAVFEHDFRNRPRNPLDVSVLSVFGWGAVTCASVKAELDDLNTQTPVYAAPSVPDEAPDLINLLGALPKYRALSDQALRALASLPDEPLAGGGTRPGNDGAFSQITFKPLQHLDPAVQDRAGPDTIGAYAPQPGLGAFQAELDGRARNRYFFRAAYVNGAHDMGALGPASPPVYLPVVEPPRTPVITRIEGGDRKITLTFASNRETDLAEYRIFRANTVREARDPRLMTQVAVIPETVSDPAARPRERCWTDEGRIGGVTCFYSLATVDALGTISPLTKAKPGVAVDLTTPPAPIWIGATWRLRRLSDSAVSDWPADNVVPAGSAAVLELSWAATTELGVYDIAVRPLGSDQTWKDVPGVGLHDDPITHSVLTVLDPEADTANPTEYRIRVRAPTGVWSVADAILPVSPPAAA